MDIGAEDLRELALVIGMHFGGAFTYGELREMPADELLELADEVREKTKEKPGASETG